MTHTETYCFYQMVAKILFSVFFFQAITLLPLNSQWIDWVQDLLTKKLHDKEIAQIKKTGCALCELATER